jgi:hypothetical protein
VKNRFSIEARTAARWWADHIRCGAELSNGDDSFGSVLASAFGSLNQDSARSKLTPEAIIAFETKLAELVDAGLEQESRWVWLSVDYHPEGTLFKAAQTLPVNSTSLFPWKTSMEVKPGRIQLKEGYGASFKDVPFLTADEVVAITAWDLPKVIDLLFMDRTYIREVANTLFVGDRLWIYFRDKSAARAFFELVVSNVKAEFLGNMA